MVPEHPRTSLVFGGQGPNIPRTFIGMPDPPLPAPLHSEKPIIGYDAAHAAFDQYKRYYQRLSFTAMIGEEVTVQGILFYHASERPIHRAIEVLVFSSTQAYS